MRLFDSNGPHLSAAWAAALAALCLALALAPPPAAAASDHFIRVPVADLDLTRPKDQQQLKARIQTAAGRLCRRIGAGGWRHLYCSKQIRASARPDYVRAVARAKAVTDS